MLAGSLSPVGHEMVMPSCHGGQRLKDLQDLKDKRLQRSWLTQHCSRHTDWGVRPSGLLGSTVVCFLSFSPLNLRLWQALSLAVGFCLRMRNPELLGRGQAEASRPAGSFSVSLVPSIQSCPVSLLPSV